MTGSPLSGEQLPVATNIGKRRIGMLSQAMFSLHTFGWLSQSARITRLNFSENCPLL